MRRLVIAVVALAVLVAAALLGWRVYSGPPAPEPQVSVGQVVADFTLADLNGQSRSLVSLRGERGTLLIFISTRCPYSNGYNERMEALHRDYSPRGIRVIGINANRNEPVDEIRQHAREKSLTFTLLKDDANRVADYFGATVTPEAYLIDPQGVLRYHGRLDASDDEPSLNANELREALDTLLNGKEISSTGKKAFGCTIKRVSS